MEIFNRMPGTARREHVKDIDSTYIVTCHMCENLTDKIVCIAILIHIIPKELVK